MKVFFDIITNHTADVIDYERGLAPGVRLQGPRAVPDGRPARRSTTATTPARARFPPLSAERLVPVHAVRARGEPRKVPEWLNDTTLYHNRGNTTFTGENSLYGDFFGLDDLFTEHPRVVRGMTDIYEAWIRDFGIDGFRIDTMKHVDDEFWQQFAARRRCATPSRQGKREFFMFGEVFDTSRPFTSRFTTTDRVAGRARLPVPGGRPDVRGRLGLDRRAARLLHRRRLVHRRATRTPTSCRRSWATTTWAASATSSSRPTAARPTPSCSPATGSRTQLMYLSRGNPVVYYGDEQGFIGDGGDQDARQDMFPSQVAPSTTTTT